MTTRIQYLQISQPFSWYINGRSKLTFSASSVTLFQFIQSMIFTMKFSALVAVATLASNAVSASAVPSANGTQEINLRTGELVRRDEVLQRNSRTLF